MIASFDGVEYRWHQLAPGTWVGILPDKWDDSIHVMNNMGRLGPSGNTTITPRDILNDRDLLQGLCQTASKCLSGAKAGAVTVLDVAGPYFDKLGTVMQQSGRDAWAFLTSGPFYQQIVTSRLKASHLHQHALTSLNGFCPSYYSRWSKSVEDSLISYVNRHDCGRDCHPIPVLRRREDSGRHEPFGRTVLLNSQR
jgi:hypothetical protein